MLKELSTKQPKGLNNTFESVIAVFRWNWNLEVLVFKEKRKPEYREKNLLHCNFQGVIITALVGLI